MEVRIGLEIHVQLTEAGSKLFCNCDSNYRDKPPNTNVCPVCLGLPGALPVPSRRAIILSLAAATALECRIPRAIVFTRKHYFYPDLPKNYQITQYERVGGSPICIGGQITYLNPDTWEWRTIKISRINLEEDPGRTTYSEGDITRSRYALVDYNRSGVPLLEIVTEPNVPSPRDARMLVEHLLLTLEYIGATNPRLEGAFRVDANISVDGGERVEIKNIGSLLDVEKALSYEEVRQKRLINSGGRVSRETRHWDSVRGVTKPLRHKETEEEYLYFPDPDLPPVIVGSELLNEARRLSSITPLNVLRRIVDLGVNRDIAWSIVSSKPAALLYMKIVEMNVDPILAARMIGVDYKGELRELRKDPSDPVNWPDPIKVKELIDLVSNGEYPYDSIKGLVLPRLARDPTVDIKAILPSKITNVDSLVEEVLREESKAVQDYLAGRRQALNYLIGAALRKARRRAFDPRLVRKILIEKIRMIEEAK